MAKRAKAVSASLDFAFFQFLWEFYRGNRGTIRTHYKELTRKFLDFNNPDKNPKAFLRQPQFEALEIYVFLKEFMDNAKVEEVFKAWFEKSGAFAGRQEGGLIGGDTRQGSMFDAVTQDQYKAVFAAMRKNSPPFSGTAKATSALPSLVTTYFPPFSICHVSSSRSSVKPA